MFIRTIAVFFSVLAYAVLVQASPEEDHQKGVEEYNRQNLVEAMELLRRSAEAGYAPAQATLAFVLDGAGEDKEAFDWYQKAANQGNGEGLFGVAKMYGSGEWSGTDDTKQADQQKAFEWMNKAAEVGYVPAMRVIVEAFLVGSMGQKVNESEGVKWLKKASDAGDPNSIRRLADAYRSGSYGLTPNEEEAERLEEKLPPESE